MPQNNSSALATFCGDTTKMLLVGFWEITPWCPPYLDILEVCNYVPKTAPCPRVISMPWMSDARVCAPEILDDREDTYAICNPGQGVPLGHTLLAMQ